jgi:hypothetical protein
VTSPRGEDFFTDKRIRPADLSSTLTVDWLGEGGLGACLVLPFRVSRVRFILYVLVDVPQDACVIREIVSCMRPVTFDRGHYNVLTLERSL